MRYRLVMLFSAVVCLIGIGSVLAQSDEDTCTDEVATALASVASVCVDVGRDQICYGNNLIDVTLADGVVESTFDTPGDRLPVGDLVSLATTPYNPEGETWGVALIALQANLEGTIPGQLVRFVVFGDTTIEPAEVEGDNAPMQAFRLSTGVGAVSCAGLPSDGLIVQVPGGETVDFNVNGVDVRVGSTAFFRTPDGDSDRLEVGTLEGNVEVTTPEGEMIAIPVGDSTIVNTDSGVASEPAPYEEGAAWGSVTELLPDIVNAPRVVPGNAGWVATGLQIEAGQTVTITAVGSLTVWPECEELCNRGDICAALCPAVTNIPPQGSVPIEDIVPESGPHVIIPGAPLGALVGRIGDGAPFLAGDAVTFTAESDGELFLNVNEDQRVLGDEEGGFVASISIVTPGEDGIDTPVADDDTSAVDDASPGASAAGSSSDDDYDDDDSDDDDGDDD